MPATRHTASVVVLAVLLGAAPAPLVASVVLDPGGLPVCAATGNQYNPTAVPAANGAAIVVWLDRRRGSTLSDLYALSVAANGTVTPGWPDDGQLLCQSGTAKAPRAVPDGAGGALVFWADSRGGETQAYAQRVNADGTLADGWPADGRVLTTGWPFKGVSDIFDVQPDGSGGAFVAWRRIEAWDNSTLGIVTRITADGAYASGWNEAGVFIYPLSQYLDALSGHFAPAPDGGVFFGLRWTDGDPFPFESFHRGTVARITPGGAALWRHHLPTHNYGFGEFLGVQGIVIAEDASGGCFSSWLESHYVSGSVTYSEFGQRYSSAGAALWPVDSSSPAYRRAEGDGGGGVFLVGSEYGTTRLDVFRRRDDGSLPPGWTAAGLTLSTPTTLGEVVTGDSEGRLFVCWSDVRPGGDADVRACEVDSAGMVVGGWVPDGTVISGATGDQTNPAFTAMSPGRMLVCWEDARTGTRDIRATRIEVPTVGVERGIAIGSGLGIRTVRPNPARGRARVAYSVPVSGTLSVGIYDLAGREVRRVAEYAAGAGPRELDVDLGGLPAGIYLLRLHQAGEAVTRRIAVLN